MAGCKKHTYRLITLAICLTLIGNLRAQQHMHLSRAAFDSLIHPPLMVNGKEMLTFDTYSINIGNISEGDNPRVATYKFQNKYDKAIQITRITTSCGCTQVQYPEYALNAGVADSLRLTFNPLNQVGNIDAYAYVYTNLSETQPIAKLVIEGVVSPIDAWRHLPQQMGALRLKRKEVTFSEIKKGQHPSISILCANTSDEPLRLSANNLPPYITFKTIPEVIEAHQEADAVITIHSDKLPNELKKQLSTAIIVRGVTATETERTIKVNIQVEY